MAVPELVAGAVLAAGGSSRFADGPKQLAELRGRPLVTTAVDAALAADALAVVFVVVGSTDLAEAVPREALVIDNPDWSRGIATSLAVAVHAADVAGMDALVVGLADQPFVDPDAWRTVARADVGRPIVVASYGGRRGNPVRLDREVWPLLPTEGDEGARTLMRGRPDLVGEIPCPGDAVDIDTVEDLDPMELINEFDVKVPVDEAWAVLTDVERIAPCLPGAQLKEVEGDEYRGIVKVKVGPISAQYSGAASFVERDDVAHRAVLDAKGRDTRGQGNANARITAELTPSGDDSTHVVVTTDLTITGKVAQFGRGVLADVSSKLMTQFVENLETTVLGVPDAAAGAGDPAADVEAIADEQGADVPHGAVATELGTSSAADGSPSPGVRLIDSPEAEPIDLLDSAGTPVVKRLAPLLGVALVAFVLWRVLRRRG